jgi:hypothetical protein
MELTESGIDCSKEIGELREQIHEKPCRVLGYCPYGPMVEEFPLPDIQRDVAIKHNEYMKKALKEGVFDGTALMSREEAEKEIAEFNEEDYPIDTGQTEWGVCGVFGHFCPVMFVAEPFVDDDEEE